MSNTNDVSSLLARLDVALGKKKPGAGKKDWAAIKKKFFKPTEGKSQIVVFTPQFASDPFTQWGFHKGLQEVDYYSVPCDAHNKNEDCVVCKVVEGLKSENWEGNKHLWMPIEQKIETYIPVIDYANATTIAEGPKWMRVGKTILNQMVESIRGLEEGEVPFYNPEAPQRVVINYDKGQPPALQYNVSFKDMKDKPSADQYAAWGEEIQPVGEYIFSRSQDDIKKMVDEYFVRIQTALDEAAELGKEERVNTEGEAAEVASKLSRLKK